MSLDLRDYAASAPPSEALAIAAALACPGATRIHVLVVDIDDRTISADVIVRSEYGVRHIHLRPFHSVSRGVHYLSKKLSQAEDND